MLQKPKNSKTKFSLKSFLTTSSKPRLVVFIIAFAVIGISTALLSHAATGDGSIPVYRSYDGKAKTHLFTTNGAEANSNAGGLNYEGVAFYAWGDANDGRMPVFRLFANNSHLYTMSVAEKEAVVKNGGKLEGVAWYAYLGAAPGRLPVYRLAAANGDHMYLTSAGERDAISGPGKAYTYEGIAFYSSDHSVPQNYNPPTGAVDTANCKNIAGWAIDKDLPDSGVPINVYIDGKGYDLGFTSVARADVNAAGHVGGAHGFNMTVPSVWRNGQAHNWVAYTLNIDSFRNVVGTNVEIKRGEWACDAAGNDIMPQILAQRAEAERQRLAAIAAAEAAQAKAEQDQKIIAYAVAVQAAKEHDALAGFLNGVAQNQRNEAARAHDTGAALRYLAAMANGGNGSQPVSGIDDGEVKNCTEWFHYSGEGWTSNNRGAVTLARCRIIAANEPPGPNPQHIDWGDSTNYNPVQIWAR